MSKMLNTAQAAIEWVVDTRQRAARLDDEADALLAQLTLAAVSESVLETTFSSQGCIGLYGHSQSAKAHLLAALCSNATGKVNIVTPDRSFDYFSHINPGHAPTNMAIRFTRDENPHDSEWPLRLRLLSEAELVQLFIAQFSALPDNRQVEKSIIEARLENGKRCVSVTLCRALPHMMLRQSVVSGAPAYRQTSSKLTMRYGTSLPRCCPHWI